ncbi:MAG: hypothetical protein GF387_02035 [Candidatus Portnoybacteria bacterium]|nr:hypothetical protein [Candidatus Portnoybacteria bacterium]
MKKIRIIRVPLGDIPEWVRTEFVGLEIPVFEIFTSAINGFQIFSRKKVTYDRGYSVKTKDLINALKEKGSLAAEAAEWIEKNILLLKQIESLIFDYCECELIDIREPDAYIVMFEDDMGKWERYWPEVHEMKDNFLLGGFISLESINIVIEKLEKDYHAKDIKVFGVREESVKIERKIAIGK